MPLFGAHLSIAGGVCRAVETAEKLGCDTFQMFTKNNNQWLGKVVPEADRCRFQQMTQASGLKFLTAHDSYLINLASPDADLRNRSIAAFRDEVLRAEELALSWLVMHPGAHIGTGETAGIERIAEALNFVRRETAATKLVVLLETTAGQGTTIGHTFDHLAEILNRLEDPTAFGVCFDTCHVFAAGYDLKRKYEETFREFDQKIGLSRLKVFHLNDSKKPLGSRVDRHEHLGRGHLGEEVFRRLVRDSTFAHLPMILETPKSDGDNKEMDAVNLALLRQWADP